MGRHPIPEQYKRSEVIALRLTKSEYDIIRGQHWNASQWVRDVVFKALEDQSKKTKSTKNN